MGDDHLDRVFGHRSLETALQLLGQLELVKALLAMQVVLFETLRFFGRQLIHQIAINDLMLFDKAMVHAHCRPPIASRRCFSARSSSDL